MLFIYWMIVDIDELNQMFLNMGIFKTGIKVLLFWSTTAKKDGKNRKSCPKLDKLDLISCFLKTKMFKIMC